MQQHGSKFLTRAPLTPSPDPGVKWSKFNFSRTWSDCIPNEIESRMRKQGSIYFARRPPPTPNQPRGWGQNELFQNMVMLHINLNGITNAATW